MARLEDISLGQRKMMKELDCSGFEGQRPWVEGPPLSERRIALVSTAGLNLRGDAVFHRDDTDYRVIPADVDPADLLMSHSSSNFDRTGFQRDINVCFPIQRLHELADEGVIGSVARFHFAVNGARPPLDMEDAAHDMARVMKADTVDTVLLVPI